MVRGSVYIGIRILTVYGYERLGRLKTEKEADTRPDISMTFQATEPKKT